MLIATLSFVSFMFLFRKKKKKNLAPHNVSLSSVTMRSILVVIAAAVVVANAQQAEQPLCEDGPPLVGADAIGQ